MSNRVVPAGSINPNATIAPGVVVIESLTPGSVSGIPTNLIGFVGTATWGPVNSPTSVAGQAAYATAFGPVQNIIYDMGTPLYAATLQGTVASYVCVRVSDGTDTNAVTRLKDTLSVGGTGALLTTLYTGTTGNTLQSTVTVGSITGTYNVTIGRPGYVAENFSNIGLGSNGSPLTGAALWTAIINAINNGVSGVRGPSQLVVASAGDSVAAVTITNAGSGYTAATIAASGGGGTGFAATVTITTGAVSAIVVTDRGIGYTSAPTLTISGDGTLATATASLISVTAPSTALNPYLYTGGTSGNGNDVSDTILLGSNTAIPTGMYALQNSGVSFFALADTTATSTWTNQDEFAQTVGAQAILMGPYGQTVAQAVTAKNEAGLTSPEDNSSVCLVGDGCQWFDTTNNVTRLISQQGFYGGLMGNLSPEQSPLNKQIFGILATQKSMANQVYSDSDVVTMMNNGIDVISIPSPGGFYFSPQTGKSIGTDLTTNNVYIQRMANFIGYSLSKSGVMGAYIGLMQTPQVQVRARNAIVSFLQNLQSNQQIEDFNVVLNATNNPNPRVVLGFMQAQVTVQLFSVIIVFLIDLNVGTVTIQS